eukprot:Protomagalhaensia_sp_Gyna_25__5182@NODE_617_length_3002_cov_111_549106_g478_i0_p4_GENE_NODE_617_length_3002_cov_111_549106_g478_i0NODE_617_length_3002_cov_111_549106_g478_i0_p4_ORF_typecomplete_len139_score15_49DUF5337/PF17272_2/0_091_NODE_617_length_3002_cov_111_549106_g478_i023252741
MALLGFCQDSETDKKARLVALCVALFLLFQLKLTRMVAERGWISKSEGIATLWEAEMPPWWALEEGKEPFLVTPGGPFRLHSGLADTVLCHPLLLRRMVGGTRPSGAGNWDSLGAVNLSGHLLPQMLDLHTSLRSECE